MDAFYVYVLWSESLGRRYVGFSRNPELRLSRHNDGWSKYTSGGIPWVLIYTERYPTETDARRRERQLKTGVGREFLNRTLRHQAGYPDRELPPGCIGYALLDGRA